MANELTVSASASYSKGNVSIDAGKNGVQVSVSGSKYVKQIQNIGTSEEQVSLGEIATPGYCFARNLDATNYISLRVQSGGNNVIRLKPGEIALFRMHPSNSLYAIADTAACNLEYCVWDN